MNKTVLLIVDVQTGLIENSPYNKDAMLENIDKLISTARHKNIEIIYVRHGEDSGEVEVGTHGWEIYEKVMPLPTEKIFDKKYNSAFKETDLKEHLENKGVESIILMGMQTELCIDTTCRVAFEYGYSIIIPKGGTTTFDNAFFKAPDLLKYYEEGIWNKRFASIMSVDDIIEKMIS